MPSRRDLNSPLLYRLFPEARPPPPETGREPESGSARRAPLAQHLVCLPRKDPSPAPPAPAGPRAAGCHPIFLAQGSYLLVLSRISHQKEREGEGGATGHARVPGSVRLRSRGEAGSRKTPILAFPRRLKRPREYSLLKGAPKEVRGWVSWRAGLLLRLHEAAAHGGCGRPVS